MVHFHTRHLLSRSSAIGSRNSIVMVPARLITIYQPDLLLEDRITLGPVKMFCSLLKNGNMSDLTSTPRTTTGKYGYGTPLTCIEQQLREFQPLLPETVPRT